ncbi:carboxypeptidase-like regulatory domain-containing protein [Bizionia paragorgiae]|uniref:Carboxypeptidase regulatory-like domain-containing protein n=1 Tax=Bizionia paragorgiae TaxID=283786 RepID=A0A1H4A8V4_BIZPA|nr:carboxypeptidase-like regulatory domain-containing protein [Bizionia paragorgiae]SEA31982.1 Carboxypeptidase regulatory-like domain-containing protein [Bizionia paragorgiae]
MKPFLICCLNFLFLFSCFDNEEIQAESHAFTISGTVLAPNNQDPISNAKVEAYLGATLKGNTLTNNTGEFNIALPAGAYRLKLSKGLFTTQQEINVNSETTLAHFTLDSLPKIGVVTGYYDNIENVLVDIGLVNPLTGFLYLILSMV